MNFGSTLNNEYFGKFNLFGKFHPRLDFISKYNVVKLICYFGRYITVAGYKLFLNFIWKYGLLCSLLLISFHFLRHLIKNHQRTTRSNFLLN